MPDEINITKHIKHTNNTLILGEINGNVERGIPSLKTALSSINSWDETIADIFSEDDHKRLWVENIADVMRIFQPAYFFDVYTDKVEGEENIVVAHKHKYTKGALEVPITSETLAFKILKQRGNRVDLPEQISDLRDLLDRGRHDYLVATKSGNPQRMKAQKDLRRRFISRLSEPVITYLIAAEACKNYTIVTKDETVTSGTENQGQQDQFVTQKLLDFDYETGETKIVERRVKLKRELVVEKPQSDNQLLIADAKLKTEVRQGKMRLAQVAKAYLEDSGSKAQLPPSTQEFLGLLQDIGVSDEILVDHIEHETNSAKLLKETFKDKQDQVKLLTIGNEENEDESENSENSVKASSSKKKKSKPVEAKEASSVANDAEAVDGEETKEKSYNSKSLLSPAQIKQLRDGLNPSELLDKVENIQGVALEYYGSDEEAQDSIIAYLHTVTPVGRKENEIALIRKTRDGEIKLKGAEGFKKYLELCLLEACEQSELVKHFQEWIKKALLGIPHEITKAEEPKWKAHHDRILHAAHEIFYDYMNKVAPVITQIMGIDAFLQIANQAIVRKPRVLIANIPTDDLLDKVYLRDNFRELTTKMNDYNQEKHEKALSIVVAPGLVANGSNQLFDIAETAGFCVFLSPEEIIGYNTVNDQKQMQKLKSAWAKNANSSPSYFQSAVLCMPDSELLSKGFKFTVGEFLAKKQKSIFETKKSISIRSCYIAAGLVARNDDTKFVEQLLVRNGVSVSLNELWPSLNLSIRDYGILWKTDFLSQGVTYSRDYSPDKLPFCIFEHKKDDNGNFENQCMITLNTLYEIGDKPMPLQEYRQAKYLDRVLVRNYPKGATKDAIGYFTDTYAGIYDRNIANSILNKEHYVLHFEEFDSSLEIKRKANDQPITRFTVKTGGVIKQKKDNS